MKFQDYVNTITIINFSFADRLRVLIGRKVTITVNVKTENVVGSTETESMVAVEKVLKKESRLGAYSTQS